MHSREPGCGRTPDNVDPRNTEPADNHGSPIAPAPDDRQAVLEEFVRDNYDHVWRIVWRIVRDEAHAEQVVQEVFLAAAGAIAGATPEAPSTPSLRQIATSRALSFASARRGPRRENRPEAPDAVLLQSSFETLERPLRAPISLKLEGLPYAEIARALDLPPETVRARLFRARDAICRYVRRKRSLA